VFPFAASDFKDTVYRQRFYDEPELKRKLVVLASVGQTHFYINFYRGPHTPAFCGKDISKVRVLSEVAVTALCRHRELSGCTSGRPEASEIPASTKPSDMYDQMRDAFVGQGWDLTPREAEICAGILMGHSTLGLSLSLGISANTVATHRKHAYAKLGIGSQCELFARFLGKSSRRFGAGSDLTLRAG
jgi:DNA-binding CsgD family transcriptional regulator